MSLATVPSEKFAVYVSASSKSCENALVYVFAWTLKNRPSAMTDNRAIMRFIVRLLLHVCLRGVLSHLHTGATIPSWVRMKSLAVVRGG